MDKETSSHVVAAIPENFDKKNMKYVVKQGAILCRQHSHFKTSKKPVSIVYAKIKNIIKTGIVGSVIVSDGKTVNV